MEEIFRREAARVLATLIRLLGDFDAAEEARQEAFAAALEQWPKDGMPDNPRAWLISTGRNKAVDRIRRDTVFRANFLEREIDAVEEVADAPADASDENAFGDDRLRLIFICCHPTLNLESQIALTLRSVCGLTTQAVARAFIVSEHTMAQRLVRAKRKIRDAGIPYETPAADVIYARIEGVMAVVYSVFTEGYAATSGAHLIEVGLCAEAIRLARLLDVMLPNNAAVLGLSALMLLHDARRAARVTDGGDLILLKDQNRSQWDRGKIDQGLRLAERSLTLRGRISPYAVQAAIAAVHVRADSAETTDWPQIVGLYAVLMRMAPTPVIELNHAVAVSMVDGPARALDLVESLAARGQVADYHLLHGARGRFLVQLGRIAEAREAYTTALGHTTSEPEQRFLKGRIAALMPSG